MNLDPCSFIVIGRRLIRPELNLTRRGKKFTIPYSFPLDVSSDEDCAGHTTAYRGALLIRKRLHLGPYSRPAPRALCKSYGEGHFLMREVPLYGWPIPARSMKGISHSRGTVTSILDLDALVGVPNTWICTRSSSDGQMDALQNMM